MKRILFLILCLGSWLFSFSQGTGYVRIEGKQFKDGNGDDFYPLVCNYLVSYVFNTSPTTFYLTPENAFDGWAFECNDNASCNSQLANNFQEMVDMGFNTVRIMGIGPTYSDANGFRIDALDHDGLNNGVYPTPKHQYFLSPPYDSDPVAMQIFAFIDDVLTAASNAGLKVILIPGRAMEDYFPAFETEYNNFLAALSNHIANLSPSSAREALMAYDLFNEPLYSRQIKWPTQTSGHSKEDICNRVSLWYSTVHNNDPVHLITLGGSSFEDIFEYDDAILKLDFWSPHIYPSKTTYEPDLYDQMIERINGHLFWLHNNFSKPYIIGETGFKAEAGQTVADGVDGDLTDQFNYASHTLQKVRDCDGSGYSWWIYQNLYWGAPGDYFGLLEHGLCSPPCSTLEKPVVQAFQNFNPTGTLNSCTEPANYFDPFNHSVYSQNTNIIHGRVLDDDGNAVRHAVVYGYTLLWTEILFPFNEHYDRRYTFTDENGNFELIPYDYDFSNFPPDPNTIVELEISASGCERVRRGWGGGTIDASTAGETFTLKRIHFKYDAFVHDKIITPNSAEQTLQGWNTLTTQYVTVQSGVTSEMKARNEVHLLPGFHAESGSDVHIFNAETQPECLPLDVFMRFANPAITNDDNESELSDIELNFILPENRFGYSIYPNPADGIFNIECISSSNLMENLEITVFDLLGNRVFEDSKHSQKFLLNLSGFTKGMYFLKINSEIQKLVID